MAESRDVVRLKEFYVQLGLPARVAHVKAKKDAVSIKNAVTDYKAAGKKKKR